MSDHEKPAMSDDEIETMAWQLETAMMEIRKDPRAALTAGLARVRSIMRAEMDTAQSADMAKANAEFAALMARAEAKVEAKFAELEGKVEAEFAALRQSCCRNVAMSDVLHGFIADQRR